VAGTWYPDDPGELAKQLQGYLDAGGLATCGEMPEALVLPHAGYRFSGPTAGVGASAVQGCAVRRVWVIGPSHHLALTGIGLYRVDAFRTPLGDLPLDRAVLERLAAQEGFDWLSGSDGGEHSIEMELPLLQQALGAFELVPLLVGRLDAATARTLADAIRPELGPEDLVVVSSDFTHHGPRFRYSPFEVGGGLGERLGELDRRAWSPVAKPDPEALEAFLRETGATVCGRHPLLLLSALVAPEAVGTELAYTTSGALTGDWTNSVSYLAGRLDGPPWRGRGPQSGTARLVEPATGEALLELAQRSLAHWFEHGRLLEVEPSELPPDATRVLGAFVTLKRDGELRGCIGEIQPQRSAWEAVLERAVDSAIHDRRFPPVTRAELPSLTVEISLLGPPREVPGGRSVIVGRHGVVLSHGPRGATFLPQVGPEQGWDRTTLLAQLAQKARLPPAQARAARIEVYEAQVVGD